MQHILSSLLLFRSEINLAFEVLEQSFDHVKALILDCKIQRVLPVSISQVQIIYFKVLFVQDVVELLSVSSDYRQVELTIVFMVLECGVFLKDALEVVLQLALVIRLVYSDVAVVGLHTSDQT